MKLRNSRRYILAVACMLLITSSRARQSPPFTQHRINEIAAECATALMDLSGLTGKQRPGESPAAYHSRITGYLAALKKLDKELAPIRRTVTPRDKRADNLAVWRKIVEDSNRLVAETQIAESAWEAVPKIGPKALLGNKLLTATTTVQSILRSLRDARP
jgi:hypothetical protein